MKNYDSVGEFIGYSLSANQTCNLISTTFTGVNSNYIGSGNSSMSNITFKGETKVLAFLTNIGPAGEQHAVEITKVNSDGTFDYFDASSGVTKKNTRATVGNMFSLQCQ